MTTSNQSLPLEELTKIGEKYYLDELKEKLEKEHTGEYVVIDAEQKKYVVDADRLIALEKAQKSFGNKLFYIVQIGNVQRPSVNFKTRKYAWNF